MNLDFAMSSAELELQHVHHLLTEWLLDDRSATFLTQLSSDELSDHEALIHPQTTPTPDTKAIPLPIPVPKVKPKKKSVQKNIPKIQPFYRRKRCSKVISHEIKQISQSWEDIADGRPALTKQQFMDITVAICEFSKYCNSVLFEQIIKHNNCNQEMDRITLSMFTSFWSSYFSESECTSFRFTRLLTAGSNREYLVKTDFEPLIRDILYQHPGLEFLRESTQFHEHYVWTVVTRIFYDIDTDQDGRITVRDLRRSKFLDVMDAMDLTMDINEIFDYFSYEHFYVIYNTFWSLDVDGDDVLTKEDLLQYDDYALTPKVIERVMAGYADNLKTLSSPNGRKKMKKEMNYEQFVHFIVSEQDKTNAVSIRYWFRVLDLDCDGVLSPYELEMFYEEQAAKIERVCKESIPFENILVALNDMIAPKVDYQFTLCDLKRSSKSRAFFNMLFNIKKFGSENERMARAQESSCDTMSDWDRYASAAYMELTQSAEDEAYSE